MTSLGLISLGLRIALGLTPLVLRVALYWLGGVLSLYGLAEFDPATGQLVLDLGRIAAALPGIAFTAATFVWSRIVKARGGAT